jgi:hypothetical protein
VNASPNQVRGELDLLDETLGADHRRELRVQDLERDLAVMPDVFGEVDGGHPARTELALDAVLVRQRLAKRFQMDASGPRCAVADGHLRGPVDVFRGEQRMGR